MKKEKIDVSKKDGLELYFEKEFNPANKIVALGFHGLGGIGHLTTRFIVESALEQGKGERIGYVIGRMIPPFVEVLDGGRFGFPYELFLIEDKVIMLLIRIQPWLDDQPILADIFTNYAKINNIKAFVLFGGVDVNVFPEKRGGDLPLVYIANKAFLDNKEDIMPKLNMEVAPKGILVSGGISLFLEYATYRNIPAAAMFSPTLKGTLDKKGAYNLAKKFIELAGLTVSLTKIKKEIDMTQKLLESLQEQGIEPRETRTTGEEDLSHVFT
ncbi:MAG: PAC2 family protein [Candidatus Njordarchaeia archaeon]